MPRQVVEQGVNIYILPEVSDTFRLGSREEVTIGDLHGNAMKLLFMLFKHGIASGITSSEYYELGQMYKLTPMVFRSYALTAPENFGFKCSFP